MLSCAVWVFARRAKSIMGISLVHCLGLVNFKRVLLCFLLPYQTSAICDYHKYNDLIPWNIVVPQLVVTWAVRVTQMSFFYTWGFKTYGLKIQILLQNETLNHNFNMVLMRPSCKFCIYSSLILEQNNYVCNDLKFKNCFDGIFISWCIF